MPLVKLYGCFYIVIGSMPVQYLYALIFIKIKKRLLTFTYFFTALYVYMLKLNKRIKCKQKQSFSLLK